MLAYDCASLSLWRPLDMRLSHDLMIKNCVIKFHFLFVLLYEVYLNGDKKDYPKYIVNGFLVKFNFYSKALDTTVKQKVQV